MVHQYTFNVLILTIVRHCGGRSSVAERQIVVLVVVGSNPIVHPIYQKYLLALIVVSIYNITYELTQQWDVAKR
jgi:hypothetical protein